jgi:phenylacetate-CoA ligase
MDEVRIKVEARASGGDDAAHGRLLAAYVKDAIGISATVEVTAPGSLPRSTGKAARVLDHRNPSLRGA